MRTILFILICGVLHAQDSLPRKNALIIDFINEHYGERVGVGVCGELAYEAAKYINPSATIDDTLNNYEIDYADIMPGDIIQFDSAYFANGDFAENHMAIVYRINHNGLITIAEQNVATKPDNQMEVIYYGEKIMVEKDSHVSLSLLDMTSLIGGKIYFFRL